MPVPLTTTAQHNQQSHFHTIAPLKTVTRKSSKPIFHWLQRKLGGSVRARRPLNPTTLKPSAESTYSGRGTSLKEFHPATARGRQPAVRDVDENGHFTRVHPARPTSNQISLNSTAEMSDPDDDDDDGLSNRRSSAAEASMWGSRSNPLEADEDASLRPLPPTSPPSPSPSRSSSSYLSDPRTFKSMTASTKPTTVLSIDLTPDVAHIAQAPPTPTSVSAYGAPAPSPVARLQSHARTPSIGYGSSVGLVTFSALPPSSPPSSRPPSLGPTMRTGPGALQAPAHTTHHPRNNPRPSSPPLDNASVLTLASSAFATPLAERGRMAGMWAGTDTASHLSHFDGTGDSISQTAPDDCGGVEPDASVRALRPRSTRRDSWESEVSRWSAGMSVLGAFGTGGRERSVRTAPSFRTGGQTLDIDDAGSVSLADEEINSTKGYGVYEISESRMETREGVDHVRSLSSARSVDDVTDERGTQESELTEIEETNDKESREVEDVATPGPAARQLVLAPSMESMPVPARPTIPPSVPNRDVQSMPRKVDTSTDNDEANHT